MLDIGTISLLLLVGMILLLMLGVPLGFSSTTLAVMVLYLKFGDAVFSSFGRGPLNILGQKIYGLITDYVLISIPLFIFMANLFERTGIAHEMYDSLKKWLSRTRGGIAIVTSIMAVIMATMSGIIGGEVVLLGLIALPQMLRLGYNQDLAVGTICAGGSLGTMIPPSIVLIIYGLVTETSVKALFTASVLPGFLLASFFIVYIMIRAQLRPQDAPLGTPSPDDPEGGEKFILFVTFLSILGVGFCVSLAARAGLLMLIETDPDTQSQFLVFSGVTLAFALLLFGLGCDRVRTAWDMGKGLVLPLGIVGLVLGSIYSGITGITEAAGMGAMAVLVLGVIRKRLSFDLIQQSLSRTISATGSIIWVTLGASTLTGAYTLAGGPTFIANTITASDVPTMGVIVMMMVVFLFLGALMDWVGIILLVMPVFLPVVLKLPPEDIGLMGSLSPQHVAIWFGVVFCMNMQVSFLSPPFGPAAFFLKSVAPPQITLVQIFRGFIPFIFLQILALSVLLVWPNIVTLLL